MKYHYVYRITNLKMNKHYYGCRSCKLNPKEDLGVKYFSSSKDISFIREQKEKPWHFSYKIIRIFENRKEAIEFEIKLHNKFDVGKNTNFYNKAKQSSSGFDTSGTTPHNKGVKPTQQQIDNIKRWCAIKDDFGISNATKRAQKSALTCKNTILENGLTIQEQMVLNHKKTLKTKMKNGLSLAQNISLKAVQTRKNTILENGLTIQEQMVLSRKDTINNNPYSQGGKVKLIIILDKYNNIIEECVGNFTDYCLKNNLPFYALRRSLYKKTRLKYSKRVKWDQKFDGWCAVYG